MRLNRRILPHRTLRARWVCAAGGAGAHQRTELEVLHGASELFARRCALSVDQRRQRQVHQRHGVVGAVGHAVVFSVTEVVRDLVVRQRAEQRGYRGRVAAASGHCESSPDLYNRAMPTETLQANRTFRVGRGSSPTVEFKQGTVITFRDDRTVSSGTLADNTRLDTMVGSGTQMIEFRGETAVTFRDDGTVSSGTLADNMRLDTMVGSGTQMIEFKSDTAVTFRDDGTVSSGTLADSKRLDTMVGSGTQMIEFKGDTAVTFRDDGTVSAGTLPGDTRLDTMVGSGTQIIKFKGGTVVTFRNDGTVFSGTLSDEETLSTPHGRKGFPAGTQLRFASDGSVET
jgi:hypothetical protein